MNVARLMTSKMALALGVFVLNPSCSRMFLIEPSGFGTNIRLGFPEGGLFSEPMLPCVYELSVEEQQWPSRDTVDTVWEIHASGDCVRLAGVDVGHLPDGFSEKVNKLPLKIGAMYAASAEAKPYRGGSSSWFACRGVPVSTEWKNDQLTAAPADCRR